MSSRSRGPARRPVMVALCLMLVAMAMAVAFAATAHAAEYKQVDCAANSGLPAYTVATNTTSPQNPAGIFTFENDCVDQGGDPPGDKSFVRISEHESGGNAGYGAYMAVTFETPTGVNFRSAGGYLREPTAFNDGWQARFGFNYMNGSLQPQLVQGAHLEGTGPGYWGTTPIFGSYLWPWSYPIDFYRWTFEMVCAAPAGCDRSNYNAVDLNGIVFTERDWEDAHASFTDTNSDLMAGRWVKGPQTVSWQASEKGSGIRMERLRLDGAERWSFDHGPECDTSSDQTRARRSGRVDRRGRRCRWRFSLVGPPVASFAWFGSRCAFARGFLPRLRSLDENIPAAVARPSGGRSRMIHTLISQAPLARIMAPGRCG